MAPRAYWTGHLRLSLVNIPEKLYPATTSERRIELHQIHQPSGKRIRYQKIAPGIGPVEAEEITKGYEYEKGKYVLIDQKEIDELKLASKQTIELARFVDEGGTLVALNDASTAAQRPAGASPSWRPSSPRPRRSSVSASAVSAWAAG